MVRIAIVEDEQHYAQELTGYLKAYEKEYDEKFTITVYQDGDGILVEYKAQFDIILMDIQMKFVDGMTAAEEIRKRDSEVVIMFITNMTQYAIRGYEVDALDYMVKPVEYFSFSQKLTRAIDRMRNRSRNFISIPVKDGIQKLDIASVYYVESQGHTLIYRTKNKTYTSRGVMKELEEALLPYGFFRSNKGYLVNMKYVDGIQEGCCVIEEEKLPISRAKKKAFMEALVNYMSEVIK